MKVFTLTLITIMTTVSVAELDEEKFSEKNAYTTSASESQMVNTKKVSASQVIDASADTVWKVLSTLNEIEKFVPQYVKHTHIDDISVGAQRRVVAHNGKTQYERIDTYEPKKRAYSYSVTNEPNYPFNDLHSYVQVKVVSEKSSLLIWTFSYKEKPAYSHSNILKIRMKEMLDNTVGGVKEFVELEVTL